MTSASSGPHISTGEIPSQSAAANLVLAQGHSAVPAPPVADVFATELEQPRRVFLGPIRTSPSAKRTAARRLHSGSGSWSTSEVWGREARRQGSTATDGSEAGQWKGDEFEIGAGLRPPEGQAGDEQDQRPGHHRRVSEPESFVIAASAPHSTVEGEEEEGEESGSTDDVPVVTEIFTASPTQSLHDVSPVSLHPPDSGGSKRALLPPSPSLLAHAPASAPPGTSAPTSGAPSLRIDTKPLRSALKEPTTLFPSLPKSSGFPSFRAGNKDKTVQFPPSSPSTEFDRSRRSFNKILEPLRRGSKILSTASSGAAPPGDQAPATPSEVLSRAGKVGFEAVLPRGEQEEVEQEEEDPLLPPRTALLRDRFLLRSAWCRHEDLPRVYDERAALKYPMDRVDDWEEVVAVWRSTGYVDIYAERSTPFRKSKELRYSIDLLHRETTISLYAAADLSFAICSPPVRHLARVSKRSVAHRRGGVGTNVYLFKALTDERAKAWLWGIWRVVNPQLPPFLDVTIPAILAHIQFPLPEPPLNHATAREIFHDRIKDICRRLTDRVDIANLPDEVRKQKRLELCWRRGQFGLEWLRDGADWWDVLSGLAMEQTHVKPRLEFRKAEHAPTSVRLGTDEILQEPPAVEGFLWRIKPVSQARARLYVSSYDSLLFLSRPGSAVPPPLPSTAHPSDPEAAWEDLCADETERAGRQIRGASGFVDLRNVVLIRRAGTGPLEGEGRDEGRRESEVGDRQRRMPLFEDGELWDSGEHEGEDGGDVGGEAGLAQTNDRPARRLARQFEVELRSGRVIRFEAYSTRLALLWIRRLASLVVYWTKRSRVDARLLMDISAAAAPSAFAMPSRKRRKYDDPDAVPEDPDAAGPMLGILWNWTILTGARPVVKIGTCFARTGTRGLWREYVHVLTADGQLHQFQMTAPLPNPNDPPPKPSKKSGDLLFHPKNASISLHHAYVIVTDSVTEAGARAPYRLYDDGLVEPQNEADELGFVVWWRKGAGKKTVGTLGKKGRRRLEIRARSRVERDHWCWCLGVEIQRLAGNDPEREESLRMAGGALP